MNSKYFFRIPSDQTCGSNLTANHNEILIMEHYHNENSLEVVDDIPYLNVELETMFSGYTMKSY